MMMLEDSVRYLILRSACPAVLTAALVELSLQPDLLTSDLLR